MKQLPADPRTPKLARQFVSDTLHSWSLDDVADVAELLTSEVVTNALLHTGAPVRLVISLTDNTVRIEAHDESPAEPVKRPHNPDANCGRGMAILDALATEWGTEPEPPNGKVVWFSLQVERDSPTQ